MQNLMEVRLPSGVIVMWSGSIASIPTGWLLCNGSNGTPNLQDRFIVGAGSAYSVAATGGSADATLPSHSHTASGTTNADGYHRHGGYSTLNLQYSGGGGRANDAPNGYATGGRYWETLDNGSHTHTFSATTSSSGSSATNANLPPYYALAYIMKA
jgi:microcystin-dependent protein